MAAGSIASSAMSKPPMNAQQSIGGVMFDNSGWAVNVGPGASQNASSAPSTVSPGVSATLRSPMVIVAILAALFFLVERK